MPMAEAVERSSRVGGRLMSLSVPMDEVPPWVLLRRGKGRARGFWARDGRWFAHVGSAATLQVNSGRNGSSRFARIWTEARDLLSHARYATESEVPPPPPRFFGGFSFQQHLRPREGWEGFPPALFVLPELELEMGRGGGTLTLRRLRTPSPDPCRGQEALLRELHQARDRLHAEAAEGGSMEEEASVETEVPATRWGTDPEAWAEAVESTLSEISRDELRKVVLARIQTASFEQAPDPVIVAMNLWAENPDSHVFLFEPTAGRALLGAAPETLARVSGRSFHATAVAGSTARGGTPEADQALAAELLESEKDRLEHRLCVEDMVTRLQGISRDVEADEEPGILALSGIQHLETTVSSKLRSGETVLSAVEALHPTPAVCGYPRDLAMEFLGTHETFQRGWYCGPVGWFDGNGNGVFVPALRSAVGGGVEWRLFAGAGIVAGSDPAREWAETHMKFQPVLRALLGIRASPRPVPGKEEETP